MKIFIQKSHNNKTKVACILKGSPKTLAPQCSWVALLESQKFDCGCQNYSLLVTSFLSHVSTWLFFCNKARILLHTYLPPKKKKRKKKKKSRCFQDHFIGWMLAKQSQNKSRHWSLLNFWAEVIVLCGSCSLYVLILQCVSPLGVQDTIWFAEEVLSKLQVVNHYF